MKVTKGYKRLFNNINIYLVLFIIATTFRISGIIINIFPIIIIGKISRYIFLYLYYKAKTQKTNTIINCFFLLNVISTFLIINDKNKIFYLIILAINRILLCTYLIKIIEWEKLTKNYLKISIAVIILILILIASLFYDNIDYYIKNSNLGVTVLICEITLLGQLILAIINILISTEKGNLYLFIGTAISAIIDGIYSSQQPSNEIIEYVYIISSILYSIKLFMYVKSSIVRINTNKNI